MAQTINPFSLCKADRLYKLFDACLNKPEPTYYYIPIACTFYRNGLLP